MIWTKFSGKIFLMPLITSVLPFASYPATTQAQENDSDSLINEQIDWANNFNIDAFFGPRQRGFYSKYPWRVEPLSQPDSSFFYWYPGEGFLARLNPTHERTREYCTKSASGNIEALELFYGSKLNFTIPTAAQGCFTNSISIPSLPDYSSNLTEEVADRVELLKQNISLIGVVESFELLFSEAMIALRTGQKLPDLRGIEKHIWNMDVCNVFEPWKAQDDWAITGFFGDEEFEKRHEQYLIDQDIDMFAFRRLVPDVSYDAFEGASDFLCVSEPMSLSEMPVAGRVGDTFYYASQADWDKYQENPLRLFNDIEASLAGIARELESLQDGEIMLRSNLSHGRGLLDLEISSIELGIQEGGYQVTLLEERRSELTQQISTIQSDLAASEGSVALRRAELQETQDRLLDLQNSEGNLDQKVETVSDQIDQLVLEIENSIGDIEVLFSECGVDIFSTCLWRGVTARVGAHEERVLADRTAALTNLERLKSELGVAVTDLTNLLSSLDATVDKESELRESLLEFVNTELPAKRESSLLKRMEVATMILAVEEQLSDLLAQIDVSEATKLEYLMIFSELSELGISSMD